MTISYVWPRVEKQNDDFNENQQIEAVTGQFFADLFKVFVKLNTSYPWRCFWSTCKHNPYSEIFVKLCEKILEYSSWCKAKVRLLSHI